MGAIQSSINSVIGSMAMARVLGNVAKPSLPKAKVQPIAPTSETQEAAPKETQQAATPQIAIDPNKTFAEIFQQNPIGLLDLQQSIQGEGMKQAVDRQKENWNQRKKILKARKRK